MSRRKQPPITGVISTSLQIPQFLHEEMQIIQQYRRELEKGDVRLNRLYREAVEYWLNARPQRELLESYHERENQQLDAEADGVLHAGR